MAAIQVDPMAQRVRQVAAEVKGARRRRLASTVGAVGLWLISLPALGQDPAPSEPPAAPAEEPAAPTEEPTEEPAQAAPSEAAPPADEAAAAEAGGDPEISLEDLPTEEPELDETLIATGDLAEQVVTVDRRKKDLQDYSGVAASFSEKKLAAVGITNAREIASMVPGLQIGVQEGNTEVFIRGVGSDNNTELGDPAVALHLDGVYIPRPRGVGSMFYDIERIEVNSGPQGTLRGRNAMGGSVNIVSARPKLGEFGANAEATFGTFAQRRYQGMVNIPVGQAVAFRFAGFTEVRDSYYVNAGPNYDITAAENADAYAYRAQFLYQPTKRFTALLGYDLTRERGTGYLGANYQGPLSAQDAMAQIIPFDVTNLENPRRVFYRGMNPAVDLLHEGYRGELTFDTGPFSLQGAASYRRLTYQQHTGANAGAVVPGYGFQPSAPTVGNAQADAFTNGFWDSNSQSLIAELRAFAPDDARLRWTAGGFYFNEDQQVFLGQNSDPANNFAGGEFNMPNVNGNSVAGYVDATFDVVEEFRVLGGARITYEEKSRTDGMWALFQRFPSTSPPVRFGTEGFRFAGLDRTQYTVDPNEDPTTGRVNLFLSGIESFGARDTLPQALCVDPPQAGEGEVQQPRLIPNPNGSGLRCNYGVRPTVPRTILDFIPQNNKVSKTFYDWRVGAEYDLTKENLLYFTVTTGHKSGGFNDTAPGLSSDQVYNSQYDPESVLAFELGSKNTFFGRDLRVNMSAFTYRYDDMVFQTIASVGDETSGGSGGDEEGDNQAAPNTAVRQNAKTTTPIYGLDADIIYRLPLGLEAEVHALLMHAKFPDGTIARDTRISDTAANNYDVDLGGNWLPRVSAYTLNYTLSQLIITTIGNFDWVIQGQTRGKHYMSVYNGEGKLLDPAPGEMASQSIDLIRLQNGGEQRLTDVVPTYTRFDVGVGWKHPSGRIALGAFVNNVTNVYYSTSIISTPGLNLRFYNPPRTAGVRFRVDW